MHTYKLTHTVNTHYSYTFTHTRTHSHAHTRIHMHINTHKRTPANTHPHARAVLQKKNTVRKVPDELRSNYSYIIPLFFSGFQLSRHAECFCFCFAGSRRSVKCVRASMTLPPASWIDGDSLARCEDLAALIAANA